MKPDIPTSIQILDDNIPKILNFSKMTYAQLETKLRELENGNYLFAKLKNKKKNFGDWFLNLDYENQISVCRVIGVELSEPENDLKKPNNSPFEQLSYYSILGVNKWTYQPMELVLLRGFTVFSLNHSVQNLFDFNFMLYGQKENFIDFKGWAGFWTQIKKLSDTGVICPERSQMPDYLLNKYGFQ